MTHRKENLVLGLGNLLRSDDGLGVHAILNLRQDPRMHAGAMLMDGGTQGLSLLAHISGFKRLLVIDAVDVGRVPGTLVRFEGTALGGLAGKATVHQLGFADLLIAMKLLGESPAEVVILGAQPESTEWGAELTPTLHRAFPILLDLVIEQVETWARLTEPTNQETIPREAAYRLSSATLRRLSSSMMRYL